MFSDGWLNEPHARSVDIVRMDDTLDKARQLRDEMVRESLQPAESPARHIHKVYPEADNEALPDAMESLLGACSGNPTTERMPVKSVAQCKSRL